MTNEHSIAYKYAKALFSAASDAGHLDLVGNDAEQIIDILTKTPELDAFLKNSAALQKDIEKTLRMVFHNFIGETTRRFLTLLVKNQRISLLEMILKRFVRLREEASNIVRVRLEYAGTLSDESKNRIISTLGGKVLLKEVRRPDLIGGTRLMVGGRLFDNSVRASAARLKSQLLMVK